MEEDFCERKEEELVGEVGRDAGEQTTGAGRD